MIKGGAAAALPPAFPSLEQLTHSFHGAELPLESRLAEPFEPELDPAVAAALRRAEAMERRAAALLAEAEEAAAVRLSDAADQVEALTLEATQQAEQLLAAARAEGLEQGRREGIEIGIAEGKAQSDEDAALMIEQAWQDADAITAEARATAAALGAQAQAEREQLLAQTESQIIELALGVARLILQREVRQEPSAILPALRAALQKLKGETAPLLRVAPEWVPFLTAQIGAVVSGLPGAPQLSVQGDPALAPGDWTLTGASGWVDGRLEAQVRLAEERIRREGP